MPAAKQIETYTTIVGDVVEFPRPAPEIAAFLDRAATATHDPTVTHNQLIELIYGRDNPILDQTIFPARGAVTRAVFEDPLYRVLLDMLDQKRATTGLLDVDKAKARFTMTVREAAERLGVHESAVRQAVKARKIASIKQGGTLLLAPDSVDAYQVTRRKPR